MTNYNRPKQLYFQCGQFSSRKSMANVAVVAALVSVLQASGLSAVQAAESASGAYLLGLRGPGAGVTPPEGIFLSSQTYFYNGDIAGNIPFEDGSILASGEVSAIVEVPTLLWMTPVQIGDARLGLSLTTPFGRTEVSGSAGPLAASDDVFTFADPSVTAFLGGRSEQLHWQFGFTGFLPIGDYQKGELANVAKHRLALDVYGALSWIDPAHGLDVTNVVGVTFNDENDVTNYKTGTEFHWEWAVTKKFENGFSFGPAGYYYQQLTDDTGTGALLGAYKGRVVAVGAAAGYDFVAGRLPVSTKLRYFNEVDTNNRLDGQSLFLSLSMPLWVAGQ